MVTYRAQRREIRPRRSDHVQPFSRWLTPLHHTECIDNALLRRERNEASQRSPKGSEVRLLARSDGDRRQAKDLCDKRKTMKDSLIDLSIIVK